MGTTSLGNFFFLFPKRRDTAAGIFITLRAALIVVHDLAYMRAIRVLL